MTWPRKSKLNESDVQRIRKMIASGIAQRDIASAMGIANSTVSAISTRQNWSSLPMEAES